MKITHILAAGALALASVGMASAQTVITITGSSAYRGAVHRAIIKVLGGSVTEGSTPTATLPANGGTGGFAYAHASNFTSANGAIFRGYLGGNNAKEVIIKTSWTGSAAGIQTVASTNSSFTVRVLPAATALSPSGTSGLSDPTNSANPADTLVPDIAMADNRQVATLFNDTFDGEPYTALTAVKVGVVPFVFVRSKGAPTSIANMTPQIARTLWRGSGRIPLSFFTGQAADSGAFVYATGRDGDSGTRINAFAEGGIGINSGVQQYDCADEQLYDAQTVNGVFYDVGQGGEKSGGTLANKMGANGLTKFYVGYMSTGDANTLTGLIGSSSLLTYNGVAYSDDNVRRGFYTFWGFEYLLYKPSLSGLKLETATTLSSQIIGTDATLKLSSMLVTRSTEGGNVTP